MSKSSPYFYCDSCFNSAKYIDSNSIDLFFCDPPYFISSGKKTSKVDTGKREDWDNQWENKEEFYNWTREWVELMYDQLKPTGSAYVCICWEHSGAFQNILEDVGFKIRNRITWKRDKGRGSSVNWKSMHEDIWFVTKSNKYTFNVEDVKVKKDIIAPYRNPDGSPKGWVEDANGNKYRYTFPGNIWVDLTVPFWSMKEVRSYAKTKKSPNNILIKHSTQKPKDLVKRCILASSNEGETVVDYFFGSGTTVVAATELGRKSIAFDISDVCAEMLKTRLDNEV